MLLEKLNFSAPAAGVPTSLAVVRMDVLMEVLVTTAIFTAFGLLVFGIAYMIIVKATPFSIRKELEEDHNTALAIVIAAVIIGIALIIAAAIQG